ncbi:sphingosine 1-phosphate receptor 1 [Platysternon megacephalum]|uniref:Sphingosine 1-phosphate receptor 1 n=1 Tax=Platysternon megacephalum TaxID=55544 RepID=A0A4D9E5J4_9SAUR|nr:sphingosine 1-phosphate receptor 1 [Platysternon megacephalum]
MGGSCFLNNPKISFQEFLVPRGNSFKEQKKNQIGPHSSESFSCQHRFLKQNSQEAILPLNFVLCLQVFLVRRGRCGLYFFQSLQVGVSPKSFLLENGIPEKAASVGYRSRPIGSRNNCLQPRTLERSPQHNMNLITCQAPAQSQYDTEVRGE